VSVNVRSIFDEFPACVDVQALVAAGSLSLKKKNVSSLVEKWQKVQQDVSDEISKENSKKMKATSQD